DGAPAFVALAGVDEDAGGSGRSGYKIGVVVTTPKYGAIVPYFGAIRTCFYGEGVVMLRLN
ncbi:hypothetical protein MNBD_CHLOROFLEXI01-4459, partial [hydrothermal vent metagenome]